MNLYILLFGRKLCEQGLRTCSPTLRNKIVLCWKQLQWKGVSTLFSVWVSLQHEEVLKNVPTSQCNKGEGPLPFFSFMAYIIIVGLCGMCLYGVFKGFFWWFFCSLSVGVDHFISRQQRSWWRSIPVIHYFHASLFVVITLRCSSLMAKGVCTLLPESTHTRRRAGKK